jgi:hypothetical protein
MQWSSTIEEQPSAESCAPPSLPRNNTTISRPSLRYAKVCPAAPRRRFHRGTISSYDESSQRRYRRKVLFSNPFSVPRLIRHSIQNLTRTMVLREDQAKATYTQKVDFAKLRSELLSADSTESSTTRASHERLTNDLAKLNSRLRDEISRTQASVRLDLNLEKGRIREEANVQELKIKETETKIEQEVAGLREKLEAVKFQTLQWLMGVCTGKIQYLVIHGCQLIL